MKKRTTHLEKTSKKLGYLAFVFTLATTTAAGVLGGRAIDTAAANNFDMDTAIKSAYTENYHTHSSGTDFNNVIDAIKQLPESPESHEVRQRFVDYVVNQSKNEAIKETKNPREGSVGAIILGSVGFIGGLIAGDATGTAISNMHYKKRSEENERNI